MRSAFRLSALTAIAAMILLSGFARSTPVGTQAQDERSPFDAHAIWSGAQRRPIQLHRHERWDWIERDVDARVVQIECVVDALENSDVDVEPLHGRVGRIVDAVRVPHPRRGPGRAFERRGAAIDRELRLTIEDDEHLFALVVKVGADAALRRDHPAVQEVEQRVLPGGGQQGGEVEVSCATVDGGRRSESGRVRVRDPRRQRASG